MKNESARGILQLIFSILIYYLIDNYFFYLLNKINFYPEGDMFVIFTLIKYILIALIVYLIYRPYIHGSKRRYSKTWITGLIFSIGSFVLLVFANYLITKILNIFHPVDGYGFVNYFDSTLTLRSIINIIIDIIIKPFLLIVIFPLGVSNIVKKPGSAAVLSGVLYGLVLGIGLRVPIDVAFFTVLVPSLIMMLITYLYKTNNNIWMIYIAYALYIAFGIYVLRYFI